jgi:hypothetical protein
MRLKMIKNHAYRLALLISALSIAVACNPDPAPPDPCAGENQSVKANFKILYGFKNIALSENGQVDTIYMPTFIDAGTVSFAATGTYDSVQWRIGNDDRIFDATKFGLRFENVLGEVSVKFIGFRKPYSACAAAKSSDTLIKKFYLKNGLNPIIGYYQGAFLSNPQDTFTVRIHFIDGGLKFESIYYIDNFPKGNPAIENTGASYRLNQGNAIIPFVNTFFFQTYYKVGYPKYQPTAIQDSTISYVTGRDSLIIKLKWDPIYNTESQTFIGIRKK